jgi:16S rRNA processing protein RimM
VSLIRFARVVRPHGLEGELSLGPSPLGPEEISRLRILTWRGREGGERRLTLVHARGAQARTLVRFAEVGTLDQAERLVGGWLLVEGTELPDPGPGVAYRFQLIGFEVLTEEGRRVGTLEDIWGTGANDVYVVRGRNEVLIPAVPEFLKRVDMAARRIVVKLLPGMDEEAASGGPG